MTRTDDSPSINLLKPTGYVMQHQFNSFHSKVSDKVTAEVPMVMSKSRLLRLWVRIPPGAWKFVFCECCMLSGRGLCDELITRPEESYRLWCVVVCDLETSLGMRRPWSALGCSAIKMVNQSRYRPGVAQRVPGS